jgi:hypothetical protein
MGSACNTHGREEVLLGKSEEERPPRRHIRKWEGNIKVDLREIGVGMILPEVMRFGIRTSGGCCVPVIKGCDFYLKRGAMLCPFIRY